MATVRGFAEWLWITKPWEEMEGNLTPGGPDDGAFSIRQLFDNWLEEQHVGDAYNQWQEDLQRKEKFFIKWLSKQSDHLNTQYMAFWDERGIIAKWTSPFSGVGYRVKQYEKFLNGLKKQRDPAAAKQNATWRASFESAFQEVSTPRCWLLEQSAKTRDNFSLYVEKNVLPHINAHQNIQWRAEYEEFIEKSALGYRSHWLIPTALSSTLVVTVIGLAYSEWTNLAVVASSLYMVGVVHILLPRGGMGIDPKARHNIKRLHKDIDELSAQIQKQHALGIQQQQIEQQHHVAVSQLHQKIADLGGQMQKYQGSWDEQRKGFAQQLLLLSQRIPTLQIEQEDDQRLDGGIPRSRSFTSLSWVARENKRHSSPPPRNPEKGG